MEFAKWLEDRGARLSQGEAQRKIESAISKKDGQKVRYLLHFLPHSDPSELNSTILKSLQELKDKGAWDFAVQNIVNHLPDSVRLHYTERLTF